MQFFECPFSLYARISPHAPALISKEQTWSYSECNKIISSIEACYRKLGIQEGDRVAISPTRKFPTPLLLFALFRIGAIACPLNIHTPTSAIQAQLNRLGASFFIHPDSLNLPKLSVPVVSFAELMNHEAEEKTQVLLDKKRAATYLFTSGTTEEPKIACLSLGNHYYSALGSNGTIKLEEGDRWLLSLPLYHVSGIAILFRCFLAGQAVVLDDQVATPETIHHFGVTHLSFVPTQLYRFLDNHDPHQFDLSKQIKCILLGGASIPHSLYKRGIKHGLNLHTTYGMTEMSSQIATNLERGAPLISHGHTLPYREIKIGEDGEVLVRGHTLFQGYLGTNHQVECPTDKEGWFHTNDLGSYSPKNGLSIHGRKDRLFISGGENIHPEEVENVIRSIDGIIDVRVDAIPDREFGHRPIAYLHSEKAFSDEELIECLGTSLPKYKIPILFLPLTPQSCADNPKHF